MSDLTTNREVTDNSRLVNRWLNRTTWGRAAGCLSILTLLLAACTANTPALVQQAEETTAETVVELVAQETIPPPPAQPPATVAPSPTTPATETAAPLPTEAPPSTATPVNTTVPTLTPSPTLTPTIAPTTTPKPSPTTEPGRYCPQTPPLKPEYSRFYLPPKKWPEPDESIAETHFWMSKPFPGAGRVLINQRFPYGWDENGRLLLHTGVDMAEDLGTPVLAVSDGTVVVAQSDYSAWYGWRCDWYGHLVVIELDQRWQDQPVYALYGHVLNLIVEPGERVTRGQPVAGVGFGGAATHPHLHFEVRIGENEFASTRNPMLWIDPGPTRGVIVGRLVDPEGRPWQGVPMALVNDEDSAEILPSWTYLGDPQSLINPDQGWAENFVFSDVLPGSHHLITQIQGVEYQALVQVTPGSVTLVEIVTEDFKTPAPQAPQEITPTATTSS